MTSNNSTSTRSVLITGASGGIGAELAKRFAADGFHVVLAARSLGKLEAIAASLSKTYGVQATAIQVDLEAADGAAKLHAEVNARGITLHALVNNAGYGLFGEFADTQLGQELAMMQLNMTSLVTLSKLFLPDLKARRGQLLNVASTAAFQPGPYMAVYYASKSFVLSFSEAIAQELGGQVQVLALCPGPTASGFQDKAAMNHSALVNGKKLPTADEVAESAYRALKSGQRVHVPGFMNWIMAQSVRFTPRRVVTWMVSTMSKPVAA
jgi:uncharacterized protein